METRGGTERIEFFQGKSRQWYFRRVAANNEVVAYGEGYQNHADAYATVAAIFKPVPWWEHGHDGEWRKVHMTGIEEPTGEDEPGQTVTEGTEEGEPLLDPQPVEPQEGAPDDAEEGPEPDEAPVEEWTYKLTSPLMRGEEVKRKVQPHLAGHNKFKENYRPGSIDGIFGETTAAASYRAKFALGYPKDQLKKTYGPTLEKYLTGETDLPDAYAARRRDRKRHATTVTPLRLKALKVARENLGVAESPMGSNRCTFSTWYGFIGPWCAMFATYCYDTQGSKAFARGSRYSYVGAVVAAARAGGRGLTVTSSPQPGDLACFGSYHMGIFEGWTSSGFNSIDGNWSNKVSRVTHSRSGVVFVRVTN